MGDKTLYDTTVPSKGSVALAHQNILRMKRGGVLENITGDITNLNPLPTDVSVARDVYGTKGVQSQDKIGSNWVITFNVEGVRASNGELVPAQAWLIDLLNIANQNGDPNKNVFDWFDALAGGIDAHEGTFGVAVAPWNTGAVDKGGWAFTLTSDGIVPVKPSPIAGNGEPTLDSALPSGAAAGELVYVRGVFLGDVTDATIGGVAAAQIHNAPGDMYTTILELPAGSAGSAPIVLTTAKGVSDPLPYVRA